MAITKALPTTTATIAVLQDYLQLCKPKVVAMLLITAFIGMQLACTSYIELTKPSSLLTMLIALIAIGCAASAAAVINHLVDVNIDAIMQRTKKRPMVNGRVKVSSAVMFAFFLTVIAMTLLSVYINTLTAILTFIGIIGYAFIYTMYLKHRTPQNIVIGGLSGALPPLLGWTSITNSIDINGALLLLIIFLWTPAHFWALAIDRVDDYKNANVPMLPVVNGIAYTKNAIVIYAFLTLVASVFPYVTNLSGILYLGCALASGTWYLKQCLTLKYDATNKSAKPCFYASINYLLALFLALLIDHYVLLLQPHLSM